ncbi:MAG: hypothetical protein KIT84_27760 [Labilithrix sp.]|nr:hypothetical protein [Labilithrix sp.]MCW5814856.1 hypothetical protein [Labilithrix sp.]
MSTNVVTGRDYFLFIDGASGGSGEFSATVKLTTGSFCGDGKVDQGEACDDGNNVNGDGCNANCRAVDGNPASGGSCNAGHPLEIWKGQTVTGTGSTADYGNSLATPSQACELTGTNTYNDHIYKVTPRASGTLTVTLTAPPAPAQLKNLMLSAHDTCSANAPATKCANDRSAGGDETMTLAVTSGKTVFIAVDGGGISDNKGDYTITFKLP